MEVTYSARLPVGAAEVLIPGGIATPHGSCIAVNAPELIEIREATTGQRLPHGPRRPRGCGHLPL